MSKSLPEMHTAPHRPESVSLEIALAALGRFMENSRSAQEMSHGFWTIVRDCCLGRI